MRDATNDTPDIAVLIRAKLATLLTNRFSDFPILKSILSIDGGAIGVGV
jgi:hypothetical protein